MGTVATRSIECELSRVDSRSIQIKVSGSQLISIGRDDLGGALLRWQGMVCQFESQAWRCKYWANCSVFPTGRVYIFEFDQEITDGQIEAWIELFSPMLKWVKT